VSTIAVSNVATAPETRYDRINTLTELQAEATLIDKDTVISKLVIRGLEGMTLLYEWVVHHLTIRVGYKMPNLSDADDSFLHVFNVMVDDLSSDKEDNNDSYPEKGGVLHNHCDGGYRVYVTPILQHSKLVWVTLDKCLILIYGFYNEVCGSSNDSASEATSVDLTGL
jgi:hypothetical protein